MRKTWMILLGLLLPGSVLAQAPLPPSWQRHTSDKLFKQRPAWSPDGKSLVYARHEGGRKIMLWLWSADQPAKRLTKVDLPQYDATWSPDGKRLAFCHVAQSGTQGDVDLYTVQPPDTETQLLLGSQGSLSHQESPAWSPDGKWIALTSTKPGNQEIFLIEPTGGDPQRITSDPALDAHPSWSHDNRSLYFATNRWGDLELARIDLTSKDVTRLTSSRGLDDYPVISPDGRWIAFTSHRSGDFDIWLVPVEGGEARNITAHPGLQNFPTWSPRSDLSFVSEDSTGYEVYSIPAESLKELTRRWGGVRPKA